MGESIGPEGYHSPMDEGAPHCVLVNAFKVPLGVTALALRLLGSGKRQNAL